MSIEATEVERIAGKLSDAQRRTLIEDISCPKSYHPAKALVGLGLWSGKKGLYGRLKADKTQLGLAVRFHLMKGQDHG